MVERLLEHEDLLMELPYLRRIREEGRQEGHQEGHQEGRREGEAEMLLRLLRIRFGTLPTDGVEGLVGVGKDAKNVVRLTDEERQTPRPQPCTLEAAWTTRLVVIACSQAAEARASWL
jgi:hypothetical protein